jgi:RimJ/RimL family protein N-acetyltransferase
MTEAHGPTLTGRHIRLRPIFPSDYEYLYALATHEQLGWRWRYRGTTPSPESFQQILWHNTLAQFVIEHVEDNRRIGHVSSFDANERAGFCHIGVLFDPGVARSGWALESLLLFFDYLFTVFNLRKLYAEVLEFNFGQFASGAEHVFKIEGRLADHDWYDGRYWEMLVLALYREDFMRDWHPRVAELIAPSPAGATG